VVVLVGHTSATVNSSFDGCYCAGGNTPLFGYETIPTTSNNVGCIGGCDGSPFNVHAEDSTVQNLKVWLGGDHNGFRAIFVQMFNGQQFTQGSIPSSGPDATITFAAGETIVGDITIDGNGVGTRVGYLAFSTSANQNFAVGDQHTPYYFNSGNSFLCGIFGQSDSEVEQLGIYMMKSIKSGSLENINYPTLSSYTVGLTPQIYQTILCNAGPDEQTQTASFTAETGEKHIWTLTLSFSVSETITVSGGVPGIVEVSDQFKWEMSTSSSYSLETDTTKSETQNFPVNVAGRTKINATFSWWNSECDVPYTATLLYQFTDGSSYEFAVSDTYNGAYITTTQGTYESTPLQTGQGCDGELRKFNETLIKSNVKL